MSADCYHVKSLVTDKPEKDNAVTNLKGPRSKVGDLSEYEAMVTSAESKCTQLRSQIDRIKEMYNMPKSSTNVDGLRPAPKSKLFVPPSRAIHTEAETAALFIKMSNPKFRGVKLTRQNSHRISTDRTGGAQGALNNILAGITKSMPMSDFMTAKSMDLDRCKTFPEKDTDTAGEPIHGVKDVKIHSKSKPIFNSKSKPKMKIRPTKSKMSTQTLTSVATAKKGKVSKVTEKRIKINNNTDNTTTKISSALDKRSIKVKVRPQPLLQQDLVEIYHNVAVKESRSSDSDVPKKTVADEWKVDKLVKSELIPPLSIEPERVLHKDLISYTSRNYAMPTISSRMKRVAKYYMNSFNIKAIPFCPATSTSPSHNIGINIQQVMNMVKIKQHPLGKLSPTLAYNIALAANKWNSNPLSMLISNTTSRTACLQCPLTKSTINYQYMQEMAKNVPQAVIEEVDEDEDAVNDSPETQSMIITGPSGDVKVSNRKQTVWTANSTDKRCTCVPQKGMEIQQIINKFNSAISKTKTNSSIATLAKKKESRLVAVPPYNNSVVESTPLQNKERKLKEVLAKLHDEFERMTQRYDELAKQTHEGADSVNVQKQLESLDKELNSKEEEIEMVMSLYKEVLALKEQVKALKERSSKDVVAVKPYQSRSNGFNEGTTASLLNKLLGRIQHFQSHYKKH